MKSGGDVIITSRVLHQKTFLSNWFILFDDILIKSQKRLNFDN